MKYALVAGAAGLAFYLAFAAGLMIFGLEINTPFRSTPGTSAAGKELGGGDDDAEKNFRRGLGFEESGDGDLAVSYYSEAIRLRGGHHLARLRRALILAGKGDCEGARRDTEAVIREVQDPGHVSKAYSIRGFAQFMAGRHQPAIQDLSEAIRLNETNYWALLVRSRTYLAANDYAAAVRDANLYLQHRPSDGLMWETRGKAHLAMRKLVIAADDFSKSIESKPSAGAFANRADCHYHLHRRDAAFSDAVRALQIDGNQKMAHLVLAMLYNDAGDDARSSYHWQLAR